MRHSLGPMVCIIVFLTFGNGSDKFASSNEAGKSSEEYPLGIKISTLNHKSTELDIAKVRHQPPSILSSEKDLLESSPPRDDRNEILGAKGQKDLPKIRRKRVGIEEPEMKENPKDQQRIESNDDKGLANESSPKKKNRAADSGPKIISLEANNMLHTHVSPRDDEPGDSMKPDSSLYSREEEVRSRHLIKVEKLLNDSRLASPVVINMSGAIKTPTIPITDETFPNDPATNPPVEFPNKGDIRNIDNVSEAEKNKFIHVNTPSSETKTDTSSNTEGSKETSSTPKSEPTSSDVQKVTEITTTKTTTSEKTVKPLEKDTTVNSKLTTTTVVPSNNTVSSTSITDTTSTTVKSVPSSSETVTESINDNSTTVSTIEETVATVKTSTDVSSTTLVQNPANKTNILASNSKQEKNDESMPSGIIALVTAIVFGIAVVVAYAGLIAWRKYLEHRYGNRELLVNDLDFDSNDLRHFEL